MRRSPRFALIPLATAMAALLGVACGSDGVKPASTAGSSTRLPSTTTTAGATAPPGAPAPLTVVIKDFKFRPTEVAAKVGDTITVINEDDAEHSMTAKDGSFDAGHFTHSTRTVQVNAAGRFEFQCEVHPFMDHGFIQVSP